MVLHGTPFAKGLGGAQHLGRALHRADGLHPLRRGGGGRRRGGRRRLVAFTVAQGTTTLFRSGVRRFDSPNLSVSVPVVAGRELRLLVTDGGNGTSNDHADWADARFTCTAPVVSPSPGTDADDRPELGTARQRPGAGVADQRLGSGRAGPQQRRAGRG
jgi:hypothetical protein